MTRPWYLITVSTVLERSEAAILDRVFRPDVGGWPREAAEAILEISFEEDDRQVMTSLLEKAKDGALSIEEAEALENYRRIGRLLEVMKSRARQSLNR
jgi:hypothetical protein